MQRKKKAGSMFLQPSQTSKSSKSQVLFLPSPRSRKNLQLSSCAIKRVPSAVNSRTHWPNWGPRKMRGVCHGRCPCTKPLRNHEITQFAPAVWSLPARPIWSPWSHINSLKELGLMASLWVKQTCSLSLPVGAGRVPRSSRQGTGLPAGQWQVDAVWSSWT